MVGAEPVSRKSNKNQTEISDFQCNVFYRQTIVRVYLLRTQENIQSRIGCNYCTFHLDLLSR